MVNKLMIAKTVLSGKEVDSKILKYLQINIYEARARIVICDNFRSILNTDLIVQIIQLPLINPPIKDKTDWARNLRNNNNKLKLGLIIKY